MQTLQSVTSPYKPQVGSTTAAGREGKGREGGATPVLGALTRLERRRTGESPFDAHVRLAHQLCLKPTAEETPNGREHSHKQHMHSFIGSAGRGKLA